MDKLYKEQLAKEGKPFIPFWRNKEEWNKAKEEMAKRKAEWEKILSGTLDVKADINLDLSSDEQDLADARAKIGEGIIELYNDLEDAQADYNDKSVELAQDHADKLAEIDSEVADKLRDIWDKLHEAQLNAQQEYQDKLADIERDLGQEIADNYTDYYRELEDIDRDYRRSVQDANRKYHEEEVKAERDYQEKLRRLREEYLFDLEDALRERDALQVIRLMRRYALDKQQAERENEQGKQSRSEAHRQELEDLRRQAEEKRQDAQRALQQEIADAQLAAQRKREDAQRALDEQLADAQEAYNKARTQIFEDQAERRADEAADYAARQAELDKDLEDRKTKILTAFGEEIGVTGASLQTVSDLFTKYFGAKGEVPKTIDNYISKIGESANETSNNVILMEGFLASLTASVQANVAAINASLATINWGALSPSGPSTPIPNTNPFNVPAPYPNSPVPKKASGASNWMLTRPQLFMAGEVPERLDITPLSQLNSDKIGGKGNGKNGKGQIEISLGKDLEGRIIDNTLSEFDVILTREMSRK